MNYRIILNSHLFDNNSKLREEFINMVRMFIMNKAYEYKDGELSIQDNEYYSILQNFYDTNLMDILYKLPLRYIKYLICIFPTLIDYEYIITEGDNNNG